MPSPYYAAGIAVEDLEAIIAYLRSLPPVSNGVPAPEPPKKPSTSMSTPVHRKDTMEWGGAP